MNHFPISAGVECSDGPCGKSITIVVHPATRDLAYVIVKDDKSVERMVPIEQVEETSTDSIRLRCSRAELATMAPFKETQFVSYIEPRHDQVAGYYGYELPYVSPEDRQYVSKEIELVPPGDLAIHRGMHVHASDGHIGKLEEFLVDPDSSHISHLVLERGHLWGKKDIAVPIDQVDYTEEDVVYLKLDKKAVKALPTITIQRHYKG